MALEVAIKKYYPDFSLDVKFYTEKGILGVLGASQAQCRKFPGKASDFREPP